MCVTRKVRINNEDELRAFVNLTNSFKSSIDIGNGNHIVDAKSVLGIYALGLSNYLEATILSTDEGEVVRFYNEMERYK